MAKIKVGGSMNYKIQIAQYEPAEVSAYIEIEDTFDKNEDIDIINDKINDKLKEQINKRMMLAVKNYHENIERMKRMI